MKTRSDSSGKVAINISKWLHCETNKKNYLSYKPRWTIQYRSRVTYHLSSREKRDASREKRDASRKKRDASREKRESLNRGVWNILLARSQCTLANWWHRRYWKVRSTKDIYRLAKNRGIFFWIKILLPNWRDRRYRKVRSTQLRNLSTRDKPRYICLNPYFFDKSMRTKI